jgi:hypothetical protein
MSKKPQSLEAVRANVLGDIEKSLAEFFDAEESRIRRLSFRNYNHRELTETLRHAQEILFDIRLQALLRISIEIRDLHAPQHERMQHGSTLPEETPPVGKQLILQCLAMSDVIAN